MDPNRSLGHKNAGKSVRCILNDATGNQNPNIPYNPGPSSSAIIQNNNITLTWDCFDPDQDPLEYDIYFSDSNPPLLIASNHTTTSYDIEQLEYEKAYYWCIVAFDSHGKFVTGDIWSFTTETVEWQCGNDLLDIRDSQSYGTVLIGNQCWMKENLNFNSVGSYVWGDIPSSGNTYGRLYGFGSNECPDGWHVPDQYKWQTLINFLGGGDVAGGYLKSTGTTQNGDGLWVDPNLGANNLSGFTGLPGGSKYTGIGGGYSGLGTIGNFWTTTFDTGELGEVYVNLASYKQSADFYTTGDPGFVYNSVRCLKNVSSSNLPPNVNLSDHLKLIFVEGYLYPNKH
jgi:uncharacterized protein (TIGR02145 family)